jgi:hypothetical protein
MVGANVPKNALVHLDPLYIPLYKPKDFKDKTLWPKGTCIYIKSGFSLIFGSPYIFFLS